MLSKKIVRFLKSGFLVISIGFSMGISGCKGNTEEPVSSEPIEIVSEKGMDDNFINIPIDIYAEATTKNKLKDMETVRKVVERFGECGYAAVDCENRVDMTQIQNVIDFCDSVEKQEKAEVTILQVSSLGGFSVYHLQTEKGVVHVIMEFGLRRAQGPDAGIFGARAAVIGGCAGTSNVLTGQMFNVPVLGTHAHSWIMSFPDEYTAFKTYARLYPNSCTLLVDTYDVLKSGVPNAIRVFEEMREEGIQLKNYGIRIDSGDLAYLSKKAYKMLAAAGFDDATISASSDLDEYLIESLKAQDAKINSWGVGTKLITADNNPAFGGVYKLAAVKDADSDAFQPKIKLSENTEKVTNPGNKTVYRIYSKKTGKIKADLICLADEKFDPEETMVIFDPVDTWKKTKVLGGTYELRELLVPVIKDGKSVYKSPSVMELRDYCKQEQNTLWDESRRFVNPQKVYVDLSQSLYDMKKALLEEMSEKEL